MKDLYFKLIEEDFLYPSEVVILKFLYLNDYDSFSHSYRVYKNSLKYLEHSGIDPQNYDLAKRAAIFHDIGKCFSINMGAIPRRITDVQERGILRFHCEYGYSLLKDYNEVLALVSLYHHNEYSNLEEDIKGCSFDKSELIKIINFIKFCDILDALSSKRSYKNAYNKKQIINILDNYSEFVEYIKIIKEV